MARLVTKDGFYIASRDMNKYDKTRNSCRGFHFMACCVLFKLTWNYSISNKIIGEFIDIANNINE